MYKRKLNQVSIFDNPTMFGKVELDPKNEWVRKAELIPWAALEEKYAEQFPSTKGQPACNFRMALGSLLIKERYQFSDEMTVEHIMMNPYLQYFIGLPEFKHCTPFDPSMLTRFRQRITPQMMQEINDVIIGRKTVEQLLAEGEDRGKNDPPNPEGHPKDQDDPPPPSGGESQGNPPEAEVPDSEGSKAEQPNSGTLILDATCAPQAIRYPTDPSLLNEARMNAEGIIDSLHAAGLTDGKKPRTYREKARRDYNRFSKCRKKSQKQFRKAKKKQLGYLSRDLRYIDEVIKKHPEEWKGALTRWQLERLDVIRVLYAQQQKMYKDGTNRIDDRIVSLSQPWVRPIVRGKQNAPVEFGAKVEMSDINGFLRVEKLSWDSFNESKTLVDSVEDYRLAYGYYPARVLADKIFRTRDNLQYCKSKGIRMNGPRLGKVPKNPKVRKQELYQEWLESGERNDIERRFGINKRCYSLGEITAKLKNTSETTIHLSVLILNLQKRLKLLLRTFWAMFMRYRMACIVQ